MFRVLKAILSPRVSNMILASCAYLAFITAGLGQHLNQTLASIVDLLRGTWSMSLDATTQRLVATPACFIGLQALVYVTFMDS